MVNDSSIIEQFRAAMRAQGIHTKDNIDGDGKIHRCHVEGDRKGSKNGWYCLHLDENPAGMFGCNKRHGAHKFSWSAKRNSKPLTAEERKQLRERAERQRAEKLAAEAAKHAAAAERAQAVWAASALAIDAHPYLVRKRVKAHGLRVGKWEVINPETGEIRVISNNALLVPICDRTRKLQNLQAILPKKLMSGGTRDKDYLAGGAKLGFFHAIGAPKEVDGKKVFIIVEGYATGASVHECTGHCVLVTFDTSNLLPVARQLRERLPDAMIIFAADNDQFTHQPVPNPGVTYAKVAAQEVVGLVAVPQFADLTDEPTDFNDLHVRQGADAVAAQILAAIDLETAIEHHAEPVPEETPPWDDIPAEAYADGGEPAEQEPAVAPAPATAKEKAAPAAPAASDYDHLEKTSGFAILGYDGGEYFLFHHGKGQVMSIRKSDITDIGLVELAEPTFWEMEFPDGKGGINKKGIAHWIFTTAHKRGIYDPSKVRGRGAWIDEGRRVFHHGGALTVDGVEMTLSSIKSKFVYQMGHALPAPREPLTDDDGLRLLRVAEMVRWTMPASAALMAGWAMLAPICGALQWRPHIWLLGAAGSGKSTVQAKFLGALLRGIGIYAQGDSTEPGIRQKLRADARPVLIDEIESNNEADKRRTEAIIGLVRKTSSESWAETLKGTATGDAMNFQIRSMFCLASINANMPTKADIDRLTKLTIKAPDKRNPKASEEHWNKLEAELNRIDGDSELSNRLLARALQLLPVIMENVKTFRRLAAMKFGTQRDGDQFGTLLAGCWSLTHSAQATEAEALEMVEKFDFKEHVEDHDQDDAQRALGEILSAKIRVGTMGDFTVYELIRESVEAHRIGVVDAPMAMATLNRHGIRVELLMNKVCLAPNEKNLCELVKGSSFVTDIKGQILRVKGAEREGKTMKFNGRTQRCISVPLGDILEDDQQDADDVPF